MAILVDCPHCSTRVLPMTGRVCPACQKNVDTPPTPEPEPEQTVEAIYSLAAEQMRDGVASFGIQKILTERGLDAEAAATVVSNLEQFKARERREAGRRMMLAGVFWCITGLVVTALTYSMASSVGGGTFVIAWGAILFGGIEFVRGFFELLKG
jgi:uncharacterized Zn finger protein (UPF0148 family)